MRRREVINLVRRKRKQRLYLCKIKGRYTWVSSAVEAFVMDCIEKKPGQQIAKAEVYEAFIKFCGRYGLPTLAKNAFSLRLQQFVPGLKETRRRVNGKPVRFWINIGLCQ